MTFAFVVKAPPHIYLTKRVPKRYTSNLQNKREMNWLKRLFTREKKEKWIATYCSDNYEVSNLGRVRSLDRVSANGRLLKGRLKKLTLCRATSYLKVTITIDGKQKRCSIHQLVYYSFNKGEPSGYKYVVDHINGDPLDNRLDNLQSVSQWENTMKGKLNKYNLPKYITASPYHYDRSKLMYCYIPVINKKQRILKSSLDLQKVLKFKEEHQKSLSIK